MHVLMMLAAGFFGLAVFFAIGNAINKSKGRRVVNTPVLFIFAWLIACVIDFYVGVFVAGYSALTELGIHLFLFPVPSVVAWFLARKEDRPT